MAVNDKGKGNFGGRKQAGLWADLAVNPLPAVKIAMNEAAHLSGLSREQIADSMNGLAQLAGIKGRVNKPTLDKWLNPQQEDYPPTLVGMYLFCRALEDDRPLAAYLKGFPEIRDLMDWAEAERTARQAKRQARRLAPKVGME